MAEPNPITQVVADLVRRFDPGGYRLSCPVAGCRWTLDVPRMELDPVIDVDRDGSGYVTHVEAMSREELESTLAVHLDGHAQLAETGAADVPLPPVPA